MTKFITGMNHFFYNILMNDSHFDYKRKFLKKSVLCSQNIERLSKICISYLFIARFWLNLTEDDRHFFYIFLLMIIANLATNKYSS